MPAADANLVLKTSGAKTASVTNATGVDFSAGDSQPVTYRLNVTSITGTQGTLAIKIQESANNSSWNDLCNFDNVTTSSGAFYVTARSPKQYRRYYATLSGTTPNFTFSVDAVFAGRYNSY